MRRSKLSEQYTMGESSNSASQTTNAHDRSTEPMLISGFGRVATLICSVLAGPYARNVAITQTYQNSEHVKAGRRIGILVLAVHMRLGSRHCGWPTALRSLPVEALIVWVVRLCARRYTPVAVAMAVVLLSPSRHYFLRGSSANILHLARITWRLILLGCRDCRIG